MNASFPFRLYAKYIAVTLLIIGALASIQFVFVFESDFQPKYIVVPALLSLILGSLLAKQRQLKELNEHQKSLFGAIVEMADEVAYLQYPQGAYQFVASGIYRLTGYPSKTFYGHNDFFSTLVHPDDKKAWEEYYGAIASLREHSKHIPDIELRIIHHAGHTVWIRHRAKPMFERGVITLYSVMNIDISRQVEQGAALQTLAIHDQLTGLPNRRALEERVHRLMAQRKAFHLVMMDLNRFKNINDSMGHTFGDQLLIKLAERFRELAGDDFCITRFGGDEFVFVLSDTATFENAFKAIESRVTEPISINGYSIELSGSFGVVLYPDDAADFESLVRYADTAMYQAKQHNEKAAMRFEQEIMQAHERTMFIERHLKQAIEHKKIIPFFQPIYDGSGRRLAGVECVARWHDTELGLIMPDEFIGIAEATDLIGTLGESILDQSLAVAQAAQNSGMPCPVFSVNVSVKQLMNQTFERQLSELLHKHHLTPDRLKLEVTETFFFDQNDQVLALITHLKSKGFHFSLDDFGTGYSALAVLQRTCLDEIKLDKHVIENIEQHPEARSLVQYLIKMAHALHIEVVAEGVETEAQKQLLQSMECDRLQGYLLCQPLDAHTFLQSFFGLSGTDTAVRHQRVNH